MLVVALEVCWWKNGGMNNCKLLIDGKNYGKEINLYFLLESSIKIGKLTEKVLEGKVDNMWFVWKNESLLKKAKMALMRTYLCLLWHMAFKLVRRNIKIS